MSPSPPCRKEPVFIRVHTLAPPVNGCSQDTARSLRSLRPWSVVSAACRLHPLASRGPLGPYILIHHPLIDAPVPGSAPSNAGRTRDARHPATAVPSVRPAGRKSWRRGRSPRVRALHRRAVCLATAQGESSCRTGVVRAQNFFVPAPREVVGAAGRPPPHGSDGPPAPLPWRSPARRAALGQTLGRTTPDPAPVHEREASPSRPSATRVTTYRPLRPPA
jgi:hypothetical protein